MMQSPPSFPQQGVHGWLVIRCDDQTVIAAHNAEEWFPLASAGKLVLAAVVVEVIQNGELRWDSLVPDVHFDPKENSHLLYPHLQGSFPLELRDVLEVMIACHDQQCANAIARELGGWDKVHEQVSLLFPHTRIDRNPRDMDRNCARLDHVAALLMKIVSGFRNEPLLWKPILAGMARQEDKVQFLPPHQVFNLTGGLPTAVIDAGFLRGFTSPDQVVYVLAGKHLEERSVSQASDVALAEMLCGFYESSKS
jgi:beta-lactamase class A